MRRTLSGGRDLAALLLLFGIFMFAVYHYKQIGNETLPHTAPSSLNAKPMGAKALFLLLSRLGYRTDRLEAGWRSLTNRDGLVIVIEPLLNSRAPEKAEVAALRRWVEGGGTALYCITAPERPLDPEDPLAGDLAIVPINRDAAEPHTISLSPSDSPFMRDVHRITVDCPMRIRPAQNAGYQILAADASGGIIGHKLLGRGHLIVVADLDLTSNSAILNEDNAQFMVNVAATSVGGSGSNILFDEYHHGAGFDGNDGADSDGILANTPFPIKLTLLHFIALSALIVYSGNRRFGAVTLPLSAPKHASTDYVRAMARLYQRSHSADIALITLASGFRRALIRSLDLPPDAPIDRIIALTQSRYGLDAQPLGTLLQRCEQIEASQRIAETELVALTNQLQEWQRRLQLVGV